MAPLAPDESRGCGHSRDRDRSCSGERPGTPPAYGEVGMVAQLVISAQTGRDQGREPVRHASPSPARPHPGMLSVVT